jgi:MYXO-CTERM domain-containing protein/uncharacterized protein (TIGR03382 family)
VSRTAPTPAGLALLLALALAPAVAAYEPVTTDAGTPIRWDRPCIWWWQQVSGSDDVPLADARDALAAGCATWQAIDALPVTFKERGLTCFDDVGVADWPGEQNLFVWREDAWPYASRVVGLTSVTFGTLNGLIVDSDTEFNGSDYAFATDGSPNAYDLQQTATHELGHLLGLGHSEDPDAVMYARSGAGALDKRVLSPDDIAGALASATPPAGRDVTPCDPALVTYGASAPYCPVQPPEHGGCAASDPAPALPWLLALLPLLLAPLTRRRRAVPAALAVLALAPTARAGMPYLTNGGDPLHWRAPDVALVLDPVFPEDLTLSGVLEAFDFGTAQWNKILAGIGPDLRATGVAECPGEVIDDRINCVYWTLNAADWRFGKNEIALTLLHFRQSTGEIVDVDINFNGAHYAWSTGACASTMTSYDLPGVATHELGHVLGLDHSTESAATMNRLTFPGNCPQRTLASDDIDTARALYADNPLPADPGPEPAPDQAADEGPTPDASPDSSGDTSQNVRGGGCAGGGSPPPLWPLSLLALAATRRRRPAPSRAPARS